MAAHSRVHVSSEFEGNGGPTLWVEITANVAENAECPLAGTRDPMASGSVQVVGDTCHVSLTTTRDEETNEVRTHTTTVGEDCICPSFCRPGCVPEVIAIEHGSLSIGAYADSRETLADVMEQVRANASQVRLRRLTTASPRTDDVGWRQEAMDRISLTEKQREAVRIAVEMGYYETPRDASLADLADRLGVTRSALSQRLNAVETKLVTALVSDL